MLVHRIVLRRAQRTTFHRANSTLSTPRVASRSIVSAAAVGGALAAGWFIAKTSSSEPDKDAKAAGAATGPLPTIAPEQNYPFKFSEPPTPAEVTGILTKHAWSFAPTGVAGVSRCDGVQLASNAQLEDRFVNGSLPAPGAPPGAGPNWLAAGVFDGHCGSQTAEAVSQALASYVHAALRGLPATASDAAVAAAVAAGFTSLDDAFTRGAQAALADDALSFAQKALRLVPATHGSCALLALFDPAARKLRVAGTGDSRAVMGRLAPDGKSWEAVALSADQNVGNEAEMARVRAEHPGEEDTLVTRKRYYMGLEPTRTFGDARQKWPIELYNDTMKRYNSNYYGRDRPLDPARYKTPPYHTARPEVTTTTVEKGRPAFLILATDGLWDTMSSEQAVALVGKWVDWEKAGRPKNKATADFGRFDLAHVEEAPQFEEKKTILQDRNAAVHLMRNALGGAHHDLISGLLAFKPPYSREVRDDMTIQVIFFE